MAVTEEASSRSEAIYLDLRQRLLRGEYTPSHRLKLSELCAERGVSVSVVREALTRLAEQGLVESQPNKGYYIPSYTAEEINDLAFMRSHIEALAVRLAIERGDAAWEASVVAAHHELRLMPRVPSQADPAANQRWSRVHSAFHAACAAACGSRRLVAMRQRLYDEAEALRQMSDMSGGVSRDVEGEHAAIVNAVTSRHANLAADLIRRHVEITADLSVKAALARPAPGGKLGRPKTFFRTGCCCTKSHPRSAPIAVGREEQPSQDPIAYTESPPTRGASTVTWVRASEGGMQVAKLVGRVAR